MNRFTFRSKLLGFPLALLTLLVVTATLVFGQAEAGSISGTVRDASGAVLPNAGITATNTATAAVRTTQTNTLGQFVIPGLEPGKYSVKLSSANFASYERTVEVTVGGRVTVDAQLTVGNVSTVVEVTAAGATEVNTQTQELSQLIDPQQMAQLPSLTRNPYDFVAVSGNVSSGDRTASGGDQNTTGRGIGYAMNGQRTSGTEILLDGVENVDLFAAGYGEQIPVDAVQEYRVITNNFDAQYGRASGGVVNLSTKGGTNNFHGSVWEFNRLSAYTANTYANDATNAAFLEGGGTGAIPAPKGSYTRNQFGFSVGGPILKDKLFFFGTTEWTRVRSNASLQGYVPTPQLLALLPANVQSFFSAYGNEAFKFGSTLTGAQVAAASGASDAFWTTTAATVPSMGLVNYTAPADAGGGDAGNIYRVVGRFDYNPSDKTQMFFRYARENIADFQGADYAAPYSQYNVGEGDWNNAELFSLNHSFSSSIFSNSKISFSRMNVIQTYNSAVQNVPELLATSGATLNGVAVQLPGLWAQFAGAGGEPYGGPQNIIQLNQDLSWIKGRHTMRFGGQYEYEQSNRAYGAYAQGLEELGTSTSQGFDNLVAGDLALFQAAINPQGKFPCSRSLTDNSLIATPSCEITLPATSPSFSRSYRYNDWAIYAQDSFRLTHRLTLNYGTRYEHFGVQHNANPQLDSNFYFGTGATVYDRLRTGSVQIAPNSPVGGMWHPNWGTISPRVGFALDVFGDGKTSLRGGFGTSYERNFGNVTFNVIQNPPNYASVQLTPSITGAPIPVTNQNFGPFSGNAGTLVPLRPSSLRHVNQNIDTAQTQFYSLGVQRELTHRTVFSLEYAGAHGVHLYDISGYNDLGGGQVYLGDPYNGFYTRPNPQFTGINTRGSRGTSRYNALNAGLQSNNLYNTGLSLTANYTWAHSLDDLSSTFSDSTGGGSNGIGNLGYLDPRNPMLDWGSSDYDIRNRLALSPIWALPWYQNGHGWQRQVLGGWTLVSVFTVRTGTPFSIFDTTNSLNAGSGYGIPRYTPVGAISSFKTGSGVINAPNDFTLMTLPIGYTVPFNSALGISDFGPFPGAMTRRNAFGGPGAWNDDLAVTKSFKITERVNLEFRAEGFDLFNHHNMYVNALNLDNFNFLTSGPGGTPGPLLVSGLKGGLGVNAIGGNHDERRFGQFALRVSF